MTAYVSICYLVYSRIWCCDNGRYGRTGIVGFIDDVGVVVVFVPSRMFNMVDDFCGDNGGTIFPESRELDNVRAERASK